MDLNKVMIIGRLARDPEVRTTTTGKSVATITIATGLVWKDAAGVKQEKTEFHSCVLWGRLAEIAGQYLVKGRKVYIEGRLQTRDWVGTDGVKRYRTEVVAENMILLDSRPQNSGVGGPAPTNEPDDMPVVSSAPVVDDSEIKVEDIPF